MKKQLAIAAMALLVSACTSMGPHGGMCGDKMKEGMMKNCPMMSEAKTCCCCKDGGMMKEGMQCMGEKEKPAPAALTPAPSEEHKKHH